MASFYTIKLGEETEFHRLLADAGLDATYVRRIIRNPELAGKMVDALRGVPSPVARKPRSSRFDQFKQYLNSLPEQKALLVAFNAQAGDLAVPAEWLEGLATSSRHVQSVEDLEIFVVWCGTVKKSLRYSQQLMKFSQGKIWDSGFNTDESSMRLHASAFAYTEPGVYRVRINLVANWVPGKARSVNDVYDKGIQPGKPLASVESIFGYALQKQGLVRQQDGKNLPYVDVAGIQQGDGFARAVDFYWGADYGGVKVYFGSWGAGDADSGGAAPVLQGVPRKVAA